MNFYILYIIIGILVFISTIVMTLWFKTNRILNLYLILTSIVLCLYLILYGLKQNGLCVSVMFNYNQVMLVLSPAVYLFFKKLINNRKYPEKQDVVFFIVPVILYYHIGLISTFRFFDCVVILIALSIYSLFFFLKSLFFLNAHIKNTIQENSNGIVESWASFILMMFGLVLLHFCAFSASSFFNSKKLKIILEFLFLAVFLIGYFKVILTPELLYGNSCLRQIKDSNFILDSSLSNVWNIKGNTERINTKDLYLKNKIEENLLYYIKKIDQVAVYDYVFRDNKFSIIELSKRVEVPKYYLDYIFKYHCNLSFNDYRRLVRIHDAIMLIKEGYLNHNKLNSLAEHVGFSSYNPFLINFKEITGLSPFDYYKNIKSNEMKR